MSSFNVCRRCQRVDFTTNSTTSLRAPTTTNTIKMEEELLKEMIRDRDIQVDLIKKKMEEQSKKMTRTVQQLKVTGTESKGERSERELEIDRMTKRYAQLCEQLKVAMEAMDMKKQQQGSSLHLYTDVMKAVATPASMDSSYVMRMQAQLCKAMHSMGIAENQLALVTRHTDIFTKFLKDNVTGMVEEKSQVELKLMNELVLADNGRREAEETIKTAMDEHRNQKEALEKKSGDNDSGSDDEEDDEEEKEELMEILEQGREEISRLEEENQKQLETLNSLKEKFKEKGLEVPVVEINEDTKNDDGDTDDDDEAD